MNNLGGDASLSEPSSGLKLPVTSSYDSVHWALEKYLGKARSYRCSCGRPALDWAYQYNAENQELSEERPDGSVRLYGTHLTENYAPMCRSCHKLLDFDKEPEKFQKVVDTFVEMASRPKSPEHSAKIWESRKSDPEGMQKHTELVSFTMKRTNARKFKCLECGHENNAGNMGIHRKKTGHTEREEI